MEDPLSGWATGESDLTTVSYTDSSLRFVHNTDSGGSYSPRQFGGSYRTIVSAGFFQPAGQGGMGLLCGTPGGTSYGALFTTSGNLVFLSISGAEVDVLQRHDELEIDIPLNAESTFIVECAMSPEGELRLMAADVDGNIFATYHGAESPEAFTSLVLYSESEETGYTLDVNGAAALGIGSDVEVSEIAADLLTHVDADFRDRCVEVPTNTLSSLAALTCFIQSDGDGADFAIYQQQASGSDMEFVYNERVDIFAVEPTDDCQTGPNETTWNIDGVDLGRLLCAPQAAGIRFDWTNTNTNVLAALVDYEGDYGLLYSDWSSAAGTP